ncbi:tetratricopeptide repeat protein [Candidatus Pelagibacter bacterium]|nr:tetratricopeptide repeat protein [Candidatus Pelagibacter bacterium]
MKKSEENFKHELLKCDKLFLEKKYQNAIEEYKKLLESNPNTQIIFLKLASIYQVIGNFNEAIDYYIKASNLDKKNIDLLNNIAHLYFHVNDYSLAKNFYKKSLDIKKDQLIVIEFYVDCLNLLGIHKEIYNFLKNVINKTPNNKFLNRIFGRSLIALNKHKEGLEYLRKGSGFIVFQDEKIRYINK